MKFLLCDLRRLFFRGLLLALCIVSSQVAFTNGIDETRRMAQERRLQQVYVQENGYADVVTKEHLVTLVYTPSGQGQGCGLFKLRFQDKETGKFSFDLKVPETGLAAFRTAGLKYDPDRQRLWLMGFGCDGTSRLLGVDVSQTEPVLHDYSANLPSPEIMSNYVIGKGGAISFYGATSMDVEGSKQYLCTLSPGEEAVKCTDLTTNDPSLPLPSKASDKDNPVQNQDKPAYVKRLFSARQTIPAQVVENLQHHQEKTYEYLSYPKLGYSDKTGQLVLVYGTIEWESNPDSPTIRKWYILGIDDTNAHVIWSQELPPTLNLVQVSEALFFGNYVALASTDKTIRVIYQFGSSQADKVSVISETVEDSRGPRLFGVQQYGTDNDMFSLGWTLYITSYLNHRTLQDSGNEGNENLVLSFLNLAGPWNEGHLIKKHLFGNQIQLTSGAPSVNGSYFAAASLNLNGTNFTTGAIPNSVMLFDLAGQLQAEARMPNTTGRNYVDNLNYYQTKVVTDQEGDAVAVYVSYQRSDHCDKELNCEFTTFLGKWLYQ